LQQQLSLSYLFISHNLATIENTAHRVLVMYLGRIVEQGPVDQVFAAPHHPYTRGLLDSVPSIIPHERDSLRPITGDLPSAIHLPRGCAFGPRCARVSASCLHTPPVLVASDGGRAHACLYPL